MYQNNFRCKRLPGSDSIAFAVSLEKNVSRERKAAFSDDDAECEPRWSATAA